MFYGLKQPLPKVQGCGLSVSLTVLRPSPSRCFGSHSSYGWDIVTRFCKLLFQPTHLARQGGLRCPSPHAWRPPSATSIETLTIHPAGCNSSGLAQRSEDIHTVEYSNPSPSSRSARTTPKRCGFRYDRIVSKLELYLWFKYPVYELGYGEPCNEIKKEREDPLIKAIKR